MARPKKQETEKRNKRITVYLTEQEETALNTIQTNLNYDKAEFMIEAMKEKITCLENPPEAIIKSRYNKISDSKEEMVNGYICSQGHVFWVDWSWPSPPRNCPCCGIKLNEKTWSGRVLRGF